VPLLELDPISVEQLRGHGVMASHSLAMNQLRHLCKQHGEGVEEHPGTQSGEWLWQSAVDGQRLAGSE
jgi:hypothetical protein